MEKNMVSEKSTTTKLVSSSQVISTEDSSRKDRKAVLIGMILKGVSISKLIIVSLNTRMQSLLAFLKQIALMLSFHPPIKTRYLNI